MSILFKGATALACLAVLSACSSLITGGDLIRPARLSDRAALVDLSRSVHASTDAHRRSLGVPAPNARSFACRIAAIIRAIRSVPDNATS